MRPYGIKIGTYTLLWNRSPFFRTRSVLFVFTKVCHWALTWASWVQLSLSQYCAAEEMIPSFGDRITMAVQWPHFEASVSRKYFGRQSGARFELVCDVWNYVNVHAITTVLRVINILMDFSPTALCCAMSSVRCLQVTCCYLAPKYYYYYYLY
jgi:hypothetical protein